MAITSHPSPSTHTHAHMHSYPSERDSSETHRTSSISSTTTSRSRNSLCSTRTYSDPSPSFTYSRSTPPTHSYASDYLNTRDPHSHKSHSSTRDTGHETHELEKPTPDLSIRELEMEARIRKRDYAVEISRIMGRQLVAAMRGGASNSKRGRRVNDAEGGGDVD